MTWILLFVAGLFEIGFALGVKYCEDFTRLWPILGMVAAGATSFYLPSLSMRSLPAGTAYAVWTGIGRGNRYPGHPVPRGVRQPPQGALPVTYSGRRDRAQILLNMSVRFRSTDGRLTGKGGSSCRLRQRVRAKPYSRTAIERVVLGRSTREEDSLYTPNNVPSA